MVIAAMQIGKSQAIIFCSEACRKRGGSRDHGMSSPKPTALSLAAGARKPVEWRELKITPAVAVRNLLRRTDDSPPNDVTA